MTDGSSERLDRMQKILELLAAHRTAFREEYELFLSAQGQLHDRLETLRRKIVAFRCHIEPLRGEFEALHAQVRQFGDNVEAMRQDTDARLKRLGG